MLNLDKSSAAEVGFSNFTAFPCCAEVFRKVFFESTDIEVWAILVVAFEPIHRLVEDFCYMIY